MSKGSTGRPIGRPKGKLDGTHVIEFRDCMECRQEFGFMTWRGGKGMFCSIQCMANARGRAMGGANHPFWRGGKSERTHVVRHTIKALIRQRGKCEECGAPDRLQGHHILGHADHEQVRADPKNIQVLCATCHAKRHPKFAQMIDRARPLSGVTKQCVECGAAYYKYKSAAEKSKWCSQPCQMKGLLKIRWAA